MEQFKSVQTFITDKGKRVKKLLFELLSNFMFLCLFNFKVGKEFLK